MDRLLINNEQKENDGGGVVQTTGTFTPTLLDGVSGGGTGSYTYTIITARYVKIGSVVFFTIGFSAINTVGTPNSLLVIGGLPFSSTEILNGSISINDFSNSNVSATDITYLAAFISDNFITFDNKTSVGAGLNSVIFASGQLWVSGFYDV